MIGNASNVGGLGTRDIGVYNGGSGVGTPKAAVEYIKIEVR